MRAAPSDNRTAISRRRATTRASSRLATFAHTIPSVMSVTMEKIARKRDACNAKGCCRRPSSNSGWA